MRQRKLSGLLISPDTQLRFGLLFLAMAVILHAAMVAIGIGLYSAWLTHPGASIYLPMSLAALIYISLYAFTFTVGMFVSHRVLGPTIAVENFLKRLKDGDFSARVHLRETDDKKMMGLATLLNDLAENLQNKIDGKTS